MVKSKTDEGYIVIPEHPEIQYDRGPYSEALRKLDVAVSEFYKLGIPGKERSTAVDIVKKIVRAASDATRAVDMSVIDDKKLKIVFSTSNTIRIDMAKVSKLENFVEPVKPEEFTVHD